VHDTLRAGRRFRCLAIDDDFSHESLAIEADFSLTGVRMTRALDAIADVRGYPEVLVQRSGKYEPSHAALVDRSSRSPALHRSRGKPVQNAFVESFNGKFRDECLNEHEFLTLGEAREIIETWRQDFNTARPTHHLQIKRARSSSERQGLMLTDSPMG
jgi:putative transposase